MGREDDTGARLHRLARVGAFARIVMQFNVTGVIIITVSLLFVGAPLVRAAIPLGAAGLVAVASLMVMLRTRRTIRRIVETQPTPLCPEDCFPVVANDEAGETGFCPECGRRFRLTDLEHYWRDPTARDDPKPIN